MTDPIKSFYERYPFPHPVNEIPQEFLNGTDAVEGCPSWLFHVYWPTKPKSLDLDVLIAGCGTKQAILQAASLPQARITAIDVSETSLEHSKKLATKYGFTNIDHKLCRIEDVATLGKQFDYIACAGVLHHLENPETGLKALKSVLKPDGSLYMMLYGKYGRECIYRAQDIIKLAGMNAENASDEEVLEAGNILDFSDFPPTTDSINNNADMLFNPRERSYSLPEIHEMLDNCGMVMQEQFNRAYYNPAKLEALSPKLYARIKPLSKFEKYAVGELWFGDVAKHRFVCCQKDRKDYRINLDDTNWKRLVPVIHPAIRLEKRDGYTAVYLPYHKFLRAEFRLNHGNQRPVLGTEMRLDDDGLRMLSAIDGEKTVAQIGAQFSVLDALYEMDIIWFRRPA